MRMLTLLLFLIAVAEGVAIWALWTHRAPCAAAAGATPAAGLLGPGGAGGGTESGSGNAAPPTPGSGAPASAAPAASAAAEGSGTNQPVSGDLNQVPDPNCVAKTTASLLNSGESTAPPSCAPMSAPPQLQQAAKQVQDGAAPASSP